jgi:hypothetical protein
MKHSYFLRLLKEEMDAVASADRIGPGSDFRSQMAGSIGSGSDKWIRRIELKVNHAHSLFINLSLGKEVRCGLLVVATYIYI